MPPSPEETTVPRATVEALAANIRELLANKAQQQLISAELIRGCVKAIQRQPSPFDDAARRRQIKEDAEKALLHLDWLATQLENSASGTLTDSVPHDA